MTLLRIDRFGGLAPILAPRKLPDGGATVANNVRLDGTDLRAWYTFSLTQQTVGLVSNLGRIYRHPPTGEWLAFPASSVVQYDIIPSPIPQDSLSRVYWSRSDSYPRVLASPTQTQIDLEGPAVRRLGVPAPPGALSAPVATLVNAGEIRRQVTSFTLAAPCEVDVGPNHPFKEGQRVKLEVTYANPQNTAGASQIAGKEFIVGTVTGNKIELRGSDATAATPLAPGDLMHVARVFSENDYTSRAYVYTLVSSNGEEGPPSFPSKVVDVRDDIDPVSCAILVGALPAGFENTISRIRLYRSQTGSNGTEYFLCASLPRETGQLSAPPGESLTLNMATTNTIIDTTPDAGIGEIMQSREWVPPPLGLTGLGHMPNGFLGGHIGNTMFFSEPYLPHAWPDRHRKTTTNDIVGWAVYGQTAVICTKGKPYLATGTDPGSMSLQVVELDAPCLSYRGIASTGTGVLFPTYDGLAFVSAESSRIVTQGLMSKRDWASYWNSEMDAIFHDGRFFAFSRFGGSNPSLCFTLTNGQLEITKLPMAIARAPARNTFNDTLHVALFSEATGLCGSIFQFNAHPVNQQAYQWDSKVFTLPRPLSFAACQVYCDGPVTVSFRARKTNSTGAPGEMLEFYSRAVTGPEPFRLPGGFVAREWQVSVTGTGSVQSIMLGATMGDIRAAA